MPLEVTIELKLDWSEMDLFGHINNVAYFKYIQAARVNYLEGIGVNTADPNNKLSFVLANSSCDFKTPLYYPSAIKVVTTVDWVKNSSLQLDHKLYNHKGELAAVGKDVIVLYDYETQTKRNIPETVKQKIGP